MTRNSISINQLLILLIISSLMFTVSTSCSDFNQELDEEAIENELKPNDWFFRQRAYPQGKINKTAYKEAIRKRSVLLNTQSLQRDENPDWIQCGPFNIGGRLVDVEMSATNSSTIYIGAAAGGIFRSYDLGQNWEPIFDDQASLSIGDIAIAPSDPNLIYVGTGEANAGGGSLAYDGLGVFKSTDAGDTWTDTGLSDVGSIGKVLVDPNNPDHAYVAAMGDLFGNNADRGVYRTEDGGASWTKSLFLNDSTGAIDLAIHPTNGDIIYAATWERIRRPSFRKYGGPASGIHKSTDGGNTWIELTGNGLPTSNKGRIGIAIANSNPDVLYAAYADETGFFKGLYKSINAGSNWNLMPDPPTNNLYSSYGWWFGKIFVDPTNEDVLFLAGIDMFRSLDGANSWENVSSGSSLHPDQHAVYIHPLDPTMVLIGNDGGLYLSNESGGQSTWNHFENLPITQFYTCEFDAQNPERLYGGTQDNSSMRTFSGAADEWEIIYFGDGFVTMVDPIDNSFVYTEYQYGNFAKSTTGGAPFSFSGALNGISNSDRKNWNTPVVFDPSNPSTLFYGSNKLYRSLNRADSWAPISGDLTDGGGNGNLIFGTLTTIAVSPVDNNIIYTGADDGSVNVTTNGGDDWTNISTDLPTRWISKVEAHPTDPMIAYLTISGYRYNDPLPHVFKTNDQGATWESISSNLPDVPVNDIIVDADNEGWIYLATDIGVFVTFTEGENWTLLGEGMPNTPIVDICLHRPTNMLLAATYGRSMYKANLKSLTSVKNINTSLATLKMNVFPNPITPLSKIYLELDESELVELQIIDQQGKLLATIFKGTLPTGKHVFDLPSLTQSATYYCVLMNEGKTLSRSILNVN